jgi:hypothetical protein
MLSIITWDDAAQIMGTNKQYRDDSRPNFKETILEFSLAERVIKNTFGVDWWQAAMDEVDSLAKGAKRETPIVHPLTPYLVAVTGRHCNPQLGGQVINLAIDLLTLLDLPEANQSLEDKIPELKTKSLQQFFEAWFEIRIAATFIKKGMGAKLLPASPKVKRPDIEVHGPDGRVFVECKTRTRLSPEERSSLKIYRKRMESRQTGVEELIRRATNQLLSLGSPTLVAVNIDLLDNAFGTLELKQLRSMMEQMEIRKPHINGVLLVFERVTTNPTTEMVQWGQELKLQQNVVNPELPNPSEFFRVLMDSKITTRPETLMLTKYAMAH